MSYKRWLFAALGWAAAGRIGALLGFTLGGGIDLINARKKTRKSSAPHHGPYRNTGTAADLNAALIVLIAAVMKGDGAVRRSELDHVKGFLRRNYSETQAKELLGLLKELNQRENIDVYGVCQQIKVNTDYTTRYQMFDFLYALASVDGDVSRGEILVLNVIRSGLGITSSDYMSIAQRHTPFHSQQRHEDQERREGQTANNKQTQSSGPNSYRILGIEPSATDDEVKRAYRRMAMKYHPDRVATLSEDIRKNAEQQFRIINEAYETIRTARGMK